MLDILATAFRFRQYLFEFAPLFLASWLGLAVVSGLAAGILGQGFGLRRRGAPPAQMGLSAELYYGTACLLWRRAGAMLAKSPMTELLIFSLSASVPAVVVTSLLDMEMLFLRLVLAVAYALILGQLVFRIRLRQARKNPGQGLERQVPLERPVSPSDEGPASPLTRMKNFALVSWRSFGGQLEQAMIPLIVGFAVAAALTIYVPAFRTRPLIGEAAWYGPYLAAAFAIPFQLTGGAEVPVAGALLVKGASQGAALSALLAAPSTAIPMMLYLRRYVGLAGIGVYIISAWLVAGSLGVLVNIGRSPFG